MFRNGTAGGGLLLIGLVVFGFGLLMLYVTLFTSADLLSDAHGRLVRLVIGIGTAVAGFLMMRLVAVGNRPKWYR